MMWALVPLRPKELRPAIRTAPLSERRQQPGGNFNPRLGDGDMRVEFFEMQVRRDLPALDHQRHFDQAGDSCGSLQMPEVGFDRGDEQGIRTVSRAAVD